MHAVYIVSPEAKFPVFFSFFWRTHNNNNNKSQKKTNKTTRIYSDIKCRILREAFVPELRGWRGHLSVSPWIIVSIYKDGGRREKKKLRGDEDRSARTGNADCARNLNRQRDEEKKNDWRVLRAVCDRISRLFLTQDINHWMRESVLPWDLTLTLRHTTAQRGRIGDEWVQWNFSSV